METLDHDDIFEGSTTRASRVLENLYAALSPAKVEWEDMSVALQELRIRGAFVPKDLEPADKARNWFWENGRPTDSKYPPSVPAESDRILDLFMLAQDFGDDKKREIENSISTRDVIMENPSRILFLILYQPKTGYGTR